MKTKTDKEQSLNVKMVPTSSLQISELNVRKEHDEPTKIEELAKSIDEYGVLQPLLVRPENGKFGVIIGSRRYSAAKKANLKELPVSVRDLTDRDSLIVSLTENLQRKDLKPVEISGGLYESVEKLEMSMQEIADKLGKRVGYVSDMISIFPITVKLEKSGTQVKNNPNDREKQAKEAIPVQHVIYVARAFRKPKLVKKLKEDPDADVKAAKALTNVKQSDAELVMNVYASNPQADIEHLVNEAQMGTLHPEIEIPEYHGGRGPKGIDIQNYVRRINEYTYELASALTDINSMPQPTDDVEVDFIRKSRDHRKLLVSELASHEASGIFSRLNYLDALIQEMMEEIERQKKK